MHIPTHLMASWIVGHRLRALRDRRLVAWAGVAADLDGLSLLAGQEAYGRWHHVVTHGLFAGLLLAGFCVLWAKQRPAVFWLSLTAFHLHLLCDLLGSGTDWPIHYFWPFSSQEFSTPFGWELDAWPNWVVGAVLITACGRLAVSSGHSFAETVLPSVADAAVVATLRHRCSASSTTNPHSLRM